MSSGGEIIDDRNFSASAKEDEQLSKEAERLLNLEEEGDFREEALGEKCGVFGCLANGDWPTTLDVAHIICLGLVGLQHRGQESAGIVTCKWVHEPFSQFRGMGLVSQVFNEPIMLQLKGNLGIGHSRYSTMGGSDNPALSQPFIVHTNYGTLAVAHNGELVNSSNLRKRILENGVGLSTGSDTELITQALSMEPPPQFRQSFIDQRFQPKTCQNCTSPNGMVNGVHEEEMHSPFNGLLTQKDSNFIARILHLMSLTPLSYSLVIMYDECIYAVRDPFGNRPLCIGALVPDKTVRDFSSVEGWVVSSESCSFPSICAKLFRDVEPGEIVKLERNKHPKTLAVVPRPDLESPPAFCIFEYVYFARPDSLMEGQMVYTVRVKCGRQLAKEAPVNFTEETKDQFIVAPIPETSVPAALGFAEESGIPYVEVFCKNRYIGRSFIQPSMRLRRLAVAKKFGPLSQNFQGKSIVLIDDSIVRGTTIGQLIRLLKDSGAKEVHIRIASPPLHFPCYMGINIPTKEELIANHLKAEQLALSLGAASLAYLSVEGLKTSVQSGIREDMINKRHYNEEQLREKIGHCTACLTGQYPVKLDF